MAYYGLYAYHEFANPAGDSYRWEILSKGFEGQAIYITHSVDGAQLKYDGLDENPLGPIGAVECILQYYNPGTLPAETFAAPNDDQYQVRVYKLAWSGEINPVRQLLFQGYLVQDAQREEWKDAPTIVTLSATDNLALLKQMPYDEAVLRANGTEYSGRLDFIAPNTVVAYLPELTPIVLGNGFIVNGSALNDGTYTISSAPIYNAGTGTYTFQVNSTIQTESGAYNYIISIVDNAFGYITLANIVAYALGATNNALFINVYANIFENGMQDRGDYLTRTFFTQTLVNSNTFQNSDGTYMPMYDVLSNVLGRFKCTLFQSLGEWHIMRRGELHYYANGAIPYTRYAPDFSEISEAVLADSVTFGFNQQMQPINQSVGKNWFRPLKFVKESFNFEQPSQLIRNADLRRHGALYKEQSVTIDGVAYIEQWYQITNDWEEYNGNQAYIVVRLDSNTGTEVTRYLRTENSGQNTAIIFNSIPVNASDKFTFSISCRTATSRDGVTIRYGYVILLYSQSGKLYSLVGQTNSSIGYEFPTDTSDPNHLHWNTIGFFNGEPNLPKAGTPPGFVPQLNFTQGESVKKEQPTTFSIPSPAIPEDGELYIYYYADNTANRPQSSDVVFATDIAFDYQAYVNNSLLVNGQYHLSEQSLLIKNNQQIDITLDDSPKNAIKGTLFVNRMNSGFTYGATITDTGWKGGGQDDKYWTLGLSLTPVANAAFSLKQQTLSRFADNTGNNFLDVGPNGLPRVNIQTIIPYECDRPGHLIVYYKVYPNTSPSSTPRYITLLDKTNITPGLHFFPIDASTSFNAGEKVYLNVTFTPETKIWQRIQQCQVIINITTTTTITSFDRTRSWHRPELTEEIKLGQITTGDTMNYLFKRRLVFEGDFKGLKTTNGGFIAPINFRTILRTAAYPGYIFVFGIATFNLGRDQISATLIEVAREDEINVNFEYKYNFSLIYKTV